MRLAIVGCGLIGHKRALAEGIAHTVTVACDIDPERASALAALTGARATGDWREAIRDDDVDAVVVATTHDRLAAIALDALEHGRHVLVEKPAGVSLQEVERIAEAAASTGLVAKVGFNHRFHPALRRAHQLTSEGIVGDLMFVRGRYGHGGRPGYEREWRCDRQRSGGGELIDQGAHLIDLANWFLGPLTLDHAVLPTYYWATAVEDNAFLSLSSPGGCRAWLHATWTEWKNMFSFEVYGRDGKLAVDGLGGSYGVERLALYRMGPGMGPPATTIWEYPGPDRSWTDEMIDFANAVESKSRPLGDITDAVRTFRVIDAAYRSRP